MSRTGDCYDNAVAESFFATLKAEHVDYEDFATSAVGTASIGDYVESFYNTSRRHSHLGYVSPIEFELKMQIARARHSPPVHGGGGNRSVEGGRDPCVGTTRPGSRGYASRVLRAPALCLACTGPVESNHAPRVSQVPGHREACTRWGST